MKAYTIGRINIITMSILPKATYTFNKIPLKISMVYFTELEQIFQKFMCNCKRIQPGAPQRRICNGVQKSGCPGNIKNMGCPHPYKSELGDGTHGAGPLRVVLHSNSFADNL